MSDGIAAANEPPTVVFLHFLGGSAESWEPVERILGDRVPCRRLDLPGFGGSPHRDGRTVAAMADAVSAALRDRPMPERWLLAGHSMGAKVALLLARRAEDGAVALRGLCGLVLAAGSPPAPEPMEERQRAEMLRWFDGDAATSRREADGYVNNNVGSALRPERHDAAVRDVLRAERDAWRHWLSVGSREDLRERIGTLRTPALVLAGEKDAALGAAAQRELMLPHLPRHRFAVLSGLAHLLPLEAPDQVAEHVAAFVSGLETETVPSGPDPARMTTRTREALAARERAGSGDASAGALSAPERDCLRAVLARVLPHDVPGVDLAAQLDVMLLAGGGDGWRFAALPEDAEAYRRGLATLDARAGAPGFAALPAAEQDAILEGAASGRDGAGPLTADALGFWFEDLRGDAARLFLAHPAVMRRANCDAYSTGPDDALTGFPGVRSVAPTGVAS